LILEVLRIFSGIFHFIKLASLTGNI
jgi:hypothetical protein